MPNEVSNISTEESSRPNEISTISTVAFNPLMADAGMELSGYCA